MRRTTWGQHCWYDIQDETEGVCVCVWSSGWKRRKCVTQTKEGWLCWIGVCRLKHRRAWEGKSEAEGARGRTEWSYMICVHYGVVSGFHSVHRRKTNNYRIIWLFRTLKFCLNSASIQFTRVLWCIVYNSNNLWLYLSFTTKKSNVWELRWELAVCFTWMR